MKNCPSSYLKADKVLVEASLWGLVFLTHIMSQFFVVSFCGFFVIACANLSIHEPLRIAILYMPHRGTNTRI